MPARSDEAVASGERLDQLQRGGEADAALAGQRGRLHFGAPGVAAAGEADADLVTAEQRMLALRRGVFLVDELALPAAVRRSVGAEIIEECVAAENAAVMQQHHPGVAAGNAVQHPYVDRVESADDAALADRTGRRNVVVAERRHDRAKHRAGLLRHVTREAIDLALRPAAHADGDCVGTDQRPVARRLAVAPGPDPRQRFRRPHPGSCRNGRMPYCRRASCRHGRTARCGRSRRRCRIRPCTIPPPRAPILPCCQPSGSPGTGNHQSCGSADRHSGTRPKDRPGNRLSGFACFARPGMTI